jgi:hypothetical protein
MPPRLKKITTKAHPQQRCGDTKNKPFVRRSLASGCAFVVEFL